MKSLLYCFLLLGARSSTSAIAQTSHTVNGIVRDTAGGTIKGAEIQILGARQRLVGAATTDAQGRFSLTVTETGSYVLEIRAPGFADTRTSISIPLDSERPLELTTGMPSLRDEVSVTASVDRAEPTTRLTQPVNVIDSNEIQLRAKSVVTQVANEEVGLHVQRTSPVMAGIFVRGLTGNKVNVFVDGVRYSTAAQRGGVNTFMDLIDPALLDSVEVLRGPNSAQYGSDALGGSLQFLSRVPSIGLQDGGQVHGLFSAQANTADYGLGSNLNSLVCGVARRRHRRVRRAADRRHPRRRRRRFPRGSDPFPRRPVGRADAGSPPGNRLPPVRRPGDSELAARQRTITCSRRIAAATRIAASATTSCSAATATSSPTCATSRSICSSPATSALAPVGSTRSASPGR